MSGARAIDVEALPLSGCNVKQNVDRTGDFYVYHPDAGTEPVSHDFPYAFEGCGSRLEKAWKILGAGTIHAKWRSVGMLRTLRQALREYQAQGMPIELPGTLARRGAVLRFLAAARRFDAQHHGRPTF